MTLSILRLQIALENDVVAARQRARQIAKLLGFDNQDQTRIATAVSEIARNTYEYAKRGTVTYQLVEDHPQKLCVLIEDTGEGIADLAAVLEGRYKSKTGMGVGIMGARRLMDRMDIQSSANGTRVLLEKMLPRSRVPVSKQGVEQVVIELTKTSGLDQLGEMKLQNQELIDTLESLRVKQEELRTLNSELENTNRGVVALYAELDEKAQALQTANEVKTRFLSNVTHELRSPVNSILNLTNLLLNDADDPLSPAQTKCVQFIDRSAKTLSEMVNDLLDLAKVEAGRIVVRPQQFDLNEVLMGLKGLFRPAAIKNPAVQFHVDEWPSILYLNTDEGKLSQILRNLISNALKFTESGEVRVQVFEIDRENLKFVVSDTGIGILKNNLDYIFDEFVQIDSPLQKKSTGTGLGLSLTKKLIQLLGGTIQVESEIGKGSKFIVTIPKSYLGPLEATYVTGEKHVIPTKVFEILVIDDDPEDRIRLIKSLKMEMNCKVTEAASGADGIQQAHSLAPDLIFLDIMMDDLTGFDVLAALRGHSQTKSIPVVIHSSQSLSGEDRNVISKLDATYFSKLAPANERSHFLRRLVRSLVDLATTDHGGRDAQP